MTRVLSFRSIDMMVQFPFGKEEDSSQDWHSSESNSSSSNTDLDSHLKKAIYELLNELMEELIDDAIWNICFEVHRSVKLEYFEIDNDIHDNQLISKKNNSIDNNEIVSYNKSVSKRKFKIEEIRVQCPNCNKIHAAVKFTDHLSSCIGGNVRASKEAANKKLADANKYDYDSDENTTKKKNKKYPTKKKQGNSFKSSKVNPPYQQMTFEERKASLDQMCGVLTRAHKMCSKSHKCSTHTDEQRKAVRSHLLREMGEQHTNGEQIDIDTVDENHT